MRADICIEIVRLGFGRLPRFHEAWSIARVPGRKNISSTGNHKLQSALLCTLRHEKKTRFSTWCIVFT